MNDMFDLWSLPWHALQRNLAASVTAPEGLTQNAVAAAVKAAPVAAMGATWLARARANLQPMARRGQ